MNNTISNDFSPTAIEIENRIFTVRGLQVMIDSHLAEMYGVELKVLNQAVKRNIERFPDTFMFQVDQNEWDFLRSQFVTLEKSKIVKPQYSTTDDNRGKHRKYLPYTFTEQGVAMLSAVLKSETAIKVSIKIINTFVEMRKILTNNALIIQRLDKMELKQLDADHQFEQIFKALERKNSVPEKGIFFEGQIFDAYLFICDILKNATESVVLIDNYVDETVLNLLAKRHANVSATIYTQKISPQLQLDVNKHNAQYPAIELKILQNSHDRFLILDRKELYHFGASLKDTGKKWFAFSRMDAFVSEVLEKLK